MFVFFILWGLYGVGFLTYSLVTQCERFIGYYNLDTATFSDFAWRAGVLHIALCLLAIWGLLSIFLIPKSFISDPTIYNVFLVLLIAAAQIATFIVLRRIWTDEPLFFKIIVHILAIIACLSVTAPLVLGISDTDEEPLGFFGALIVLAIAILLISFLVFSAIWLFATHPILAFLIILFAVLVYCFSGYTVIIIIFQ